MSRVVWKFDLAHDLRSRVQIVLPKGSKPVAIGEKYGRIYMWVEVDQLAEGHFPLVYKVVGTGASIPDDMTHVGTCVTGTGFVWHLYRERDE